MHLQKTIKSKLREFLDICESCRVSRMYAFGSSITDDFDKVASDIDLLVEVDENDPVERGEKLMELWDQLENFFERKVDLLTEPSIKNPFLKKSIDETKVLIYDRESQKISV